MLAKDNLTAKINLDAQVLNLLEFNAGVGKYSESVEDIQHGVTNEIARSINR